MDAMEQIEELSSDRVEILKKMDELYKTVVSTTGDSAKAAFKEYMRLEMEYDQLSRRITQIWENSVISEPKTFWKKLFKK